MLRNFKQSYAQAPHITSDGVALPGDAFGCHVVGGTDEGVGVSFGSELSGHTKITQLDLTIPAKQDVTGLDVSVNDTMRVKICQTVQNAFCDFAKHLFARATSELLDLAVHCVQ